MEKLEEIKIMWLIILLVFPFMLLAEILKRNQ
nr:MAG TPA: hypothetical protein [Caudoviricetes sp.]